MKTNKWSLLKDQFDALVHNEGVHEDSLEQCLDYEIHRRFGELIARAAQHKTKGSYGTRDWTQYSNAAGLSSGPTNA